MIKDVEIKKLKIFSDNRGWLMEILRADDKIFTKFGQMYITACNSNVAKAWHYHEKQIDYFTVIEGKAKIVLYDHREDSPTKGEINEFIVSKKNPMVIKIPIHIIHGFTALDNKPTWILSCTTEIYDPKNPDKIRIPFNTKEINYKWECDTGR